MKEHKITVDVHASYSGTPPRYRVFLDHDLLTERDFTFSGAEFLIRENIFVNLDPGTHILEIVQVNENGTITANNVIIDGHPSSFEFVTY